MADDPKPQADKFRNPARELGCGEDEGAFEERVRQIAPKHEPRPKDDAGSD
jgi:hypothetical protein